MPADETTPEEPEDPTEAARRAIFEAMDGTTQAEAEAQDAPADEEE